MFCFVFLKFIMSKLLPYVSDALFDMLDFSDFPQLLVWFFFKQFKQDGKTSVSPRIPFSCPS